MNDKKWGQFKELKASPLWCDASRMNHERLAQTLSMHVQVCLISIISELTKLGDKVPLLPLHI